MTRSHPGGATPRIPPQEGQPDAMESAAAALAFLEGIGQACEDELAALTESRIE